MEKEKPLKIVFRGLASVVNICWWLDFVTWGEQNADQASVLSSPKYNYLIKTIKKTVGLSAAPSAILLLSLAAGSL